MPPTEAETTSFDAVAAGWVERWWRGEAGRWGTVLDAALAPVEAGFRVVAGVHHRTYSAGWRSAVRLSVPVISVGNIAVGGTGKTPVVRWLVDMLRDRGARPAVLHGGYAPDEPALHRSWHPDTPVLTGRDRATTGRAAVEAGATILVLDDGFQHRRLARDLDLVLVAAEGWTTRPRLLPRGPWRERPRALARADIVAVTRKVASAADVARVEADVRRMAADALVVRITIRPVGWRSVREGEFVDSPKGGAVAVAAIGRPDLFVQNARAAGAEVDRVLAFRDHHAYVARDLDRIRSAAGGGKAIVTTAKDAIKLGPLAPDLDLWILEQTVTVETGADALARRLDALTA